MGVLFLTGAGISANAGIPTYRQAGSSWTDSDLEAKSHSNRYGNHLAELWDRHWGPLSKLIRTAEPTRAHQAIAEFQSRRPTIIATQNIDSLHEQAGSDNVAHLHGVIEAVCMRCKDTDVSRWLGNGAPVCNKCGSFKTRPNVVLFGEMLNSKMMGGIEYFAQHKASHILAVGTSLNVYPAAGLVLDTIGKKNVIIINKEPTAFDKFATKVYHEDADKIIDEVLAEVDKTVEV